MSAPDKSIDSRLLASAKAEFLRNGFLKAELKTICGSAEITTGAVYKRYKGKEELFCAVVRDTVNALERFLAERSDVDFSALSDRQIYDSWIMTFDAMQPMFKLLYRYRDTFYLLIDKAAGTRYEDFSHEYTPQWVFFAMIAICLIGGTIGGLLGTKVLRKHFLKAGMA